MISFYEMEKRFGAAAAFHCLLEIEKATNICSQSQASVDFETRLQNACRAQDEKMRSEKVA